MTVYSLAIGSPFRTSGACILACCIPLALAGVAHAVSYQVVDLNGSCVLSGALDATTSWQAGYGYPAVPGYSHAMIWNSTAASIVDLNPAGYSTSQAFGMSSSQVVGYGIPSAPGSSYHALLWSGPSRTLTDLNPNLNKPISQAYGTDGTHQVGWASWIVTANGVDTRYTHAAVWNGTAASYADINPAGFDVSYAKRVSGTNIVGWAYPTASSSTYHAILWSGASWTPTDLNPDNFTSSYAGGFAGLREVGFGRGTPTGGMDHALLWNNSASDYVDLHPGGTLYSSSKAYSGSATQEVGVGVWAADGKSHAILWNDSASDYVDLSQFLPNGWTNSFAVAIDSQGTISGYANDPSGNTHAILFVPVSAPEPASLAIFGLGAVALLRRRRAE